MVASYDTERIWTVPNVLSMLRLLGVPIFLVLVLYYKADLAAVTVLMISGFTDWLDGFLARRWHQISRLGQMLDPIADRLYILATLLGLAFRDVIPWWLVFALVGRDVMLAFLVPLLKTRGYTSLPVHLLGKAATFCLLYAFPLVLLGSDDGLGLEIARIIGWAFTGWGVSLYWWAGLLYVRQTWMLLQQTERVSS
ncbi:MAG: CDP-diacylglycerol--glycerol-3-phosphate 3-phosphatidyltransferase [Propionibacterium sp.]|nr:MAG: CDP-diacylglycerol--glycerol-3-phosphate 3-phosphatidyltransferase [Propionibacterium sp.]